MTTQMQSLFEQLHSDNALTRSKAVLDLGKLGDESAIDSLIQVMCHDKEVFVQEDATWALCRFGSAALEPLMGLLNNESADVRHNAAHTLGKIGDLRAADALTRALQDSSERVRLKAAYALSQIGDVTALDALVDALGDSSLEVRYMVGDALQSFGERAVLPLCNALTHDDCDVRELAIGILGEIGSENTVGLLIEAMQDECWQVRCAVVQALGMTGDKRAIAPIEAAAQHDENERVRHLAVVMLRRMKR